MRILLVGDDHELISQIQEIALTLRSQISIEIEESHEAANRNLKKGSIRVPELIIIDQNLENSTAIMRNTTAIRSKTGQKIKVMLVTSLDSKNPSEHESFEEIFSSGVNCC